MVKTRTLAQKLVASGRVRLNRERQTSASQAIKIGDTLTVTLDAAVRVLRVEALGERRGPASEARTLYADLSPPPPPRGEAPPPLSAGRDPGAGRPTKRDRRSIDAFRRQDFPEPDK